jgi:predicted MFS family arabinose efflux permease
MMFGLGSGALIMPSLAQRLITSFGWRYTFSIIGAAILLFTVPILGRFLKEKPEPTVTATDDVSDTARAHDDLGMTWHDAWQSRTYWLLLCAFVLVSASIHACFTHMAPILADRGSSAQAAALASSLFGGGLLVGRTASGYLLDCFFGPRVAAVFFGGAASGIALLCVTSSRELAFTAALLTGFGLGAEGDVMAYLTTRYFGLRSFGEIYGFIFAGFVLAGGLGAFLMGAAFDARGSYALPLVSFCIVAFIGAGLMLGLGPYRYGTSLPLEGSPKAAILAPGS